MTGTDEWLALEEELALKRARTRLLDFMAYMKPDYNWNWHIKVLCTLLHEMIDGTNKRLIVSMPPRHGKSETCSRYLPAFLLGLNPKLRIIGCSYSADLATKLCREVQHIIAEDDEYPKVFPNTYLNSKNRVTLADGSFLRNSEMFETVGHRGVYKSAGRGQGITGHGADWLILDDMIKDAAEAESDPVKNGLWEWYSTTARTRLSMGGRVLVIATRWSDDDLSGRLIEQARTFKDGDQWKVINLPAINEHGPSEFDRRQPGEVLWPALWPLKELVPHMASRRTWQSLYQGDPVPPGGAIIEEKWWRRYEQHELPQQFDEIICSWDLSFTGNQNSDYTVGQAWGKKDGRAYLLNQFRAKVPFTRQVDAVVNLRNQYPKCRAVLVEKAANGDALMDALRPYVPNLVPIKPEGSKSARAQAITPILEAGNVYIPRSETHPWAEDLVIECTRFPSGRHDDMVDCLTQALRRLFPPMAYTGPIQFHSTTRPNTLARL